MSMREHPKAIRRLEADPENALLMRRFGKLMRWWGHKEKSESNVVALVGSDWVFVGRRGLIHKGGKP